MLALLPLPGQQCTTYAITHRYTTSPSHRLVAALVHYYYTALHTPTIIVPWLAAPLQEEAEVAWDLHHAGARTRKRASETKSAFFLPCARGSRQEGQEGRESAGEVVSAVSPPFSATFRPSSFFLFCFPTRRSANSRVDRRAELNARLVGRNSVCDQRILPAI